MTVLPIRYSGVKESGPTLDDHTRIVLEDFIQDVISDVRATPEAFPHPPPKPPPPRKKGQKKRRPKTGLPFYQTGALIRGITFRLASRGGMTSGILGYVIAPAGRFEHPSRFVAKMLRDRFVAMVDQLHVARGVGWSRARDTIGKQLVGLIEKFGGGGR